MRLRLLIAALNRQVDALPGRRGRSPAASPRSGYRPFVITSGAGPRVSHSHELRPGPRIAASGTHDSPEGCRGYWRERNDGAPGELFRRITMNAA
jgi:hypothetical protein